MNRMPPEILRLILDKLSEAEYCGGEYPPSNIDIKALRLSCRTFADLTPGYLYHDLWLYMEEDSFARLKAVADHPKYKDMARVLKIFPKLLSDDLLLKEDYETCLAEITFTGDDREGWGFDIDGFRYLSQEQIDAGFAEYINLHGQQAETRAKAQDFLHAALTAFTRLKAITTGFAEEILDNDEWFRQCGKIQEIARKTLMAVDCDGWQSGIHDPEDAIMIFKAITSSGLQGLRLRLGGDYGSFDATLVDIPLSSLEATKQALASLNYLELRLAVTSYEALQLREVTDACYLARFLGYAANLRCLHVGGDLAIFPGCFGEIFSTNPQWSNLKHSALSGLIVGCDDMNGFIDRHAATLEQLDLTAMLLISGSWKRMFANMRGKTALKRVVVGDLAVVTADTEPEIFNISWGQAFDGLLAGFIFGGKEWSSELPAGYSQEAKWFS